MAKEGNEKFKSYTKCCICDNYYIDNEFKVRDHCHITGIYWGSVHKHCNINLKLNCKIFVLFHNLQCDFHLIMQELGKFNLKIIVMPNGLEKIYQLSYQ